MVGLVLVSHSRKLAEAVRELVLQMTGPDFPVVVASGVGDNFDDLGTDAVHIADVLQNLNCPEGILVLMDLGSAVLSAQTALELLESASRPIQLCSAALVEGAISAAVSAQAGGTLAEVALEAERGLAGKQQQLQDDTAQPAKVTEQRPGLSTPGKFAEIVVPVENPHGLHARPAAALVQMASRFSSSIEVFNLTSGAGPAPARSLTSLALLQVRQGDRIKVTCHGDDHEAAVQAIRVLAATGFGEPLDAPLSATVKVKPLLAGSQSYPGSDGVAIGPLATLETLTLPESEMPAGEPHEELAKLTATMKSVGEELHREGEKSSSPSGSSGVLEAQALILADPAVVTKLESVLVNKKSSAVRAWWEVTEELASQYAAMDDAYLRERAADVRDIQRRVLRHLTTGASQMLIQLPQPSILFAHELLPSEAAACDPATVLGVITAKGSATAHSAIILRTLGIPMVVGASGIGEGDAGKTVAMDGTSGEFWINPSPDVIARLKRSKQLLAQRQGVAYADRRQPSITTDGVHIEVLANVGTAQDAVAAVENGADGVGLLRTEFLFVSRRQAPTEDEQVQALRDIYAPVSGPVVVRTLDVGADKPVPFLPQPAERNPYLGVRGIRLSLNSQELFLTHLRAILRSAVGRDVWLMFPMIAVVQEAEQALEALEQAHHDLQAQGISHRWPLKRGVMIEVPSAALISGQLAEQLDFFSIGTNDLTQYTMAAERGNAAVGSLQDAAHPAVLRLMKFVVDGARTRSRHVSVCGDAASDPACAAAFAGLGIHSLSVRPRQVPEIKALFRNLSAAELDSVATRAMQCHSAAAARQIIRNCLRSVGSSENSKDEVREG